MYRSLFIALSLAFSLTSSGAASILKVYPFGSASVDAGSADVFGSLSEAMAQAQAGDQIWLHGGVYREAWKLEKSGTASAPILIRNVPGERVILDGRDPVEGTVEAVSPGVYRVPFEGEVKQLFWNETPLLLARWPNVTPDRLVTRDGWEPVHMMSRYGYIRDLHLPEDKSFTGATILLNVFHQFFTWGRKVTAHEPEKNQLFYEKTLAKEIEMRKDWPWWHDDFYYLEGLFNMLDFPGEYIQQKGYLYFMLPEGADLASGRLYVKQRDYALKLSQARHVKLQGLDFFATALMVTSSNVAVSDCHFRYPSFDQTPAEYDPVAKKNNKAIPTVSVTGDHNRFEWCSIAHSYSRALTVSGQNNVVRNILVEDANWHGSLLDPGIVIYGPAGCTPNLVEDSTVREFGGIGIRIGGGQGFVRNNDIYNGGYLSFDVSLIYAIGASIDGSVIEGNWVHGNRAGHLGIGIRGDDQTRGLTMRNNIVWNCPDVGLEIKGDRNVMTGNISFDTKFGLLYESPPEPKKEWVEQDPLLEAQNSNSVLKDNIVDGLCGLRGRPFYGKLSGDVDNNTVFTNEWLDQQTDGEPANKIAFLVAKMSEAQRAAMPTDPGCRNGVIAVQGGDGFLYLRLRMPVDEEVSLSVEAKNGSGNIYAGELVFTPGNWDRFQMLPVVNDPVALRVSTPAWGQAVAADIRPDTVLSFPKSRPSVR